MMLRSLLFFSFLFLSFVTNAQQQIQQYFDGTDTLKYRIDSTTGNIWQVGRPQKTIFDSAATWPNAMVTDTVNFVPDSNVSRFRLTIDGNSFGIPGAYIMAIRWKQKLDMAKDSMGGIVEYSTDSGATWKNVFNNPHVHNFYGYDSTNRDTLLSTGDYSFSGRDTTWRDIWVCFRSVPFAGHRRLDIRFTFRSDSVVNNYEGWMIDNLIAHRTFVHTVTHGPQIKDKVLVYPTVTNGIVNIEQLAADTKMGKMQLFNQDGRLMQEYSPGARSQIDIGLYPEGVYYLKVEADKTKKAYKLILAK